MSAEAMREVAAKIVEASDMSVIGKAQAALIRALPVPPDPVRDELLAALKAAEEYMSVGVTPYKQPYPLERIRAAIAKAEGRS